MQDIYKVIKNSAFECKAKEEFMSSPDGLKELLYDVGGDLATVFGMDWRDIFKNANQYPDFSSHYDGFNDVWNIAFHIWMSKQGYIVSTANKYRVCQCIQGVEPILDDETTSNKLDERIKQKVREDEERLKRGEEVSKKACKIIEHNLQKAHPDLIMRLWYKSGTDDPGCLFWEHELYDGTKGRRPWYGEYDDEIDKKLRLKIEQGKIDNYKATLFSFGGIALVIALFFLVAYNKIFAIVFGSIVLIIVLFLLFVRFG